MRKTVIVVSVVGAFCLLVGLLALLLASTGHSQAGAIIVAAEDGDESAISALLRQDPNLVNARNGIGETPLHVAAMNGNHKRIVQELLSKGANPNARGGGNETPLMAFAVSDGKDSLEIGRILLANGADVNARNQAGTTALTMAINNGNSDKAELLRQHGGIE